MSANPLKLPPLRVIELKAENVKKLVAVQIRPDSNLVVITGKNGQGKTSVLDCIWWAIEGARNIQKQPIRKGQQRAFVTLDLGPIVITRTFTRKGETEFTTGLEVSSEDGATYKSPQAVIDGLIGALSFDPLQFARMDEPEQFEAMRKFVPDVDFKAVDDANDKDYKRRTDVGRLMKEASAAAMMVNVPSDTPEEETDESALLEELNEAHRTNADITERKGNRENALESIRIAREASATVEEHIQKSIASIEAARDKEVARLEALIAEARQACAQAIEVDSRRLHSESARNREMADRLQEKLDSLGPLPELTDTEAISAKIKRASQTNVQVRRLGEMRKHEALAAKYKQEWDELTENMNARTKAKQDAIAASKLPVPGLAFGNGVMLLNEVPLKQASDAEQLRVSVKIAMAAAPTLRVIRIREGSLLDDESLAILGEECKAEEFQCWIERVDSNAKVGFILEDGHVRHAVESAAEVTA